MKSNISKKELRDFGILIGFGLPFFIGFIIPHLLGHSFKSWTFFIGVPILTLGIIKPSLLFYPFKFWMILGEILGWINSRIILGCIFFLVLIPISFFMKIFGYDPLKKINKDISSYRELKIDSKIDLNRIF